MPKYRVHLEVNVSESIVVEADDAEQAVERAIDQAPGYLFDPYNKEVNMGEWDESDTPPELVS